MSFFYSSSVFFLFGLAETKEVGETANMLDIVTAMQLAGKAIHIG